MITALASALATSSDHPPAPWRPSRTQRFDWRDEGASTGATGAQNRAALERTAGKAASVDNGIVVLGYEPEPFDLELWRPATSGLTIDGSGSTIRQVVPDSVASRMIGDEYSTLAAFAIGPQAANLKIDNIEITQDAGAIAALPGFSLTTFMGPVCIRRADGVEFHNTRITASVGPGFIWRGGNDGVFIGELHACRGIVHTGFKNDPFAGDHGPAQTAAMYTPRRFRGEIRLVGSPNDKTGLPHFHMTGGSDWDLALDFVDLTDADCDALRIYCNDYGIYGPDGVIRDPVMRGLIRRLDVSGSARTACIVEGRSNEPGIDDTLYRCEVDFSGPVCIRVTGDGTSATGQGIHLKNASGVSGEAWVESTSSPLLVSGVSDRKLTGEYRCTAGGLGGMTLFTAPTAVLGDVILPRLVASGPADERIERFGLARAGPTSYTSEASVTRLESHSLVPQARLIETAGMRGSTVLGDLLVDIVTDAHGAASGLENSYVLAFNSGPFPVQLGQVQLTERRGRRTRTRGVTVNSASRFEAEIVGLPLILSHAGKSEVRGHLLSDLETVDALEVDGTGTHIIHAIIESRTRRRAAVLRSGLTRFAATALIKAGSMTSGSPLTMTGGVAEFTAAAGAFDYTGSGAPVHFEGAGKVGGDLGTHANLNGRGTLWSDDNRIPARFTLARARFRGGPRS